MVWLALASVANLGALLEALLPGDGLRSREKDRHEVS